MHVSRIVCKVFPGLGATPPHLFFFPKDNLGGFGSSVADYQTLVFKITAILNLVTVN